MDTIYYMMQEKKKKEKRIQSLFKLNTMVIMVSHLIFDIYV